MPDRSNSSTAAPTVDDAVRVLATAIADAFLDRLEARGIDLSAPAAPAPLPTTAASPGDGPRPRLVRVQDAAVELGIRDQAVRKLVSTGQLRALRVGKNIRVRRSSLDALAVGDLDAARTYITRRGWSQRHEHVGGRR